jgi:hypothetical protein
MSARKQAVGVRAALFAAAMCGIGLLASPANATKVGPYFPIPNGFAISGDAKDALLKIQISWLQNGLDNLKKARAEAQAELEKGAKPELEEKVKKLDADIEATGKEIALAGDDDPSREVQGERKRLFMLAVNSWINELNHLATEQMKIAILKDGMEAQVAQNRNYQLSEQADNLEKAKHDSSIENWGK